jgi:hypothetical protein
MNLPLCFAEKGTFYCVLDMDNLIVSDGLTREEAEQIVKAVNHSAWLDEKSIVPRLCSLLAQALSADVIWSAKDVNFIANDWRKEAAELLKEIPDHQKDRRST